MIMIDEKEIRKAASTKHNPAFGVSGYLAARTAFAAGVEWFKKALWHDASEMPERGKAFIFTATSNNSKHYHVGVMYNPMDYDKNCEFWGVTEWLYIEDLLPNK